MPSSLSLRAAVFLSTPSARRATRDQRSYLNLIHISIHALCEEGDIVIDDLGNQVTDFYPRPLRGGRRGRYFL